MALWFTYKTHSKAVMCEIESDMELCTYQPLPKSLHQERKKQNKLNEGKGETDMAAYEIKPVKKGARGALINHRTTYPNYCPE